MRQIPGNLTLILALLYIQVFLTNCSRPKEDNVNSYNFPSPEILYKQLFYDIQTDASIFPDCKTFVDVIPKQPVNEILAAYYRIKDTANSEQRKDFVLQHFIVPQYNPSVFTDSSDILTHINKLWDYLYHKPDTFVSGTLIPLPYPYVVPGGRFREMYYWDSYFTLLGLVAANKKDTAVQMTDNFAWLIHTFGFIPNGNRSYYLSRSQPPFFAAMVNLLAGKWGDTTYLKYLEPLETEYNFWMQSTGIAETDTKFIQTDKRLVIFPGGEVLNRYWDDKTTPRPESYREDVTTAIKAKNENKYQSYNTIYRDLRAAAESGWDFSSRWIIPDKQGKYKLQNIKTTEFVPVDLNALLFNLEKTLAKCYQIKGATDKYNLYTKKYLARQRAINSILLDSISGFYFDYNIESRKPGEVMSLAAVYPLFFNIASEKTAKQVAEKVKKYFLKPGGVVTTINHTGQQWDAPNGWAPLQWLTIKGLQNYGNTDLANTIKQRWLRLNTKVYNKKFKLTEKYNVVDTLLSGGGGEYPNQDGFGWTNGVFEALSLE